MVFDMLVTLTHPNQSQKWSNASETLKNGLSMKKYVGAVPRKLYQLAIAAEIDHFENYHAVGKNSEHLGTQKKHETI